jgi:predicted nucleic acid-binding protein
VSFLIDTNVAIYLRDGNRSIIARLDDLSAQPALSILTQIELEGGVYSRPELTDRRRAAVDKMLASMEVHDFTAVEASAYRDILAARGYVRSRVTDRMIAATAIAHGLTLITINAGDFQDIPSLSLEIWPDPAAQ